MDVMVVNRMLQVQLLVCHNLLLWSHVTISPCFNDLWYRDVKGLSLFSSFLIHLLVRVAQHIIKDSYGSTSCIPLFRLLLSANILVH